MRNWLKEIRKTHNLTQHEVAIACGISRTMVTEVENGKAMPSPKTAKKIATFLGFHWTKFYEEHKEPKHVTNNDSLKVATKKSNKKVI